LAAPAYAHVPVLTGPDGTKLAKSRRTLPLDAAPLRPLVTVFGLLGLAPPACLEEASPAEAFAWGIARWRMETAPRRLSLPVNY
jgi:glutamyl-Q tRNA(Asp) synthetase